MCASEAHQTLQNAGRMHRWRQISCWLYSGSMRITGLGVGYTPQLRPLPQLPLLFGSMLQTGGQWAIQALARARRYQPQHRVNFCRNTFLIQPPVCRLVGAAPVLSQSLVATSAGRLSCTLSCPAGIASAAAAAAAASAAACCCSAAAPAAPLAPAGFIDDPVARYSKKTRGSTASTFSTPPQVGKTTQLTLTTPHHPGL